MVIKEHVSKKVKGYFLALSLAYGKNGTVKSNINNQIRSFGYCKNGEDNVFSMTVLVGNTKRKYVFFGLIPWGWEEELIECVSTSEVNEIPEEAGNGNARVYIYNGGKIIDKYEVPFKWEEKNDSVHVRIYDEVKDLEYDLKKLLK